MKDIFNKEKFAEEKVPNELKILSIGNSFSEDATKHLYLIAKDLGIENVVIGNVYKGGCSLETHYKNILEDKADYIFYVADSNTRAMTADPVMRGIKYCIEYEDWDFITLQQASNVSGMESSYLNLKPFIEKVKEFKGEKAKLYWHMTWAYEQDSSHPGFANYNNDQKTMYEAILSTVKSLIETNGDIEGIIPSGKTIQKLRYSPLGDTLTRDGFHLSYGIGRYAAALTYLATFTKCDVNRIKACPEEFPEVEENLEYIKRAVIESFE